MKLLRTLIPTILLLALLAAPGATLTAHAQTKIATVDMRKLLNGYWKTKQSNAILETRKADLRKELKDMADGLDKAQTDYKQLLSQADDPTISDSERERRKQAVSDKAKTINDSKAAYDQFSRQAEVQLQDQVQRMTSNLIADIQAAIKTKAKLTGYSLVLNSTSDAVAFDAGDADLTADVLAQLNAGAPIDLSPAASTNSSTLPAGLPATNP
jgi:Skp family chaperone for outer membrane proteins